MNSLTKKIALRENRTTNPLNANSVIHHVQSVGSLPRHDDDDDDVGLQFTAPLGRIRLSDFISVMNLYNRK